MAKRMWSAALALAIGWSCAQGPRSEARPPDLPVNPQVNCPDGRVTETGPEGFATPDIILPAVSDLSWLEVVLPGMAMKAIQDTTPAAETPTVQQAQMERYRQAQRMFQLGVTYQQRGLLTKARTCFEEAHLVSPETRYGRQAMERLAALEEAARDNGGAEEAEEKPGSAPSGGNNHRNMMRQTDPLGTVPSESY